MGVAALEDILKGASSEVASKIRLSQHLIDWTSRLQYFRDRENDRKQFMADVEAGKRSLQMLSCNLLSYQQEGMLHLAFQGRAILADEMGLGKTIQAIALKHYTFASRLRMSKMPKFYWLLSCRGWKIFPQP